MHVFGRKMHLPTCLSYFFKNVFLLRVRKMKKRIYRQSYVLPISYRTPRQTHRQTDRQFPYQSFTNSLASNYLLFSSCVQRRRNSLETHLQRPMHLRSAVLYSPLLFFSQKFFSHSSMSQPFQRHTDFNSSGIEPHETPGSTW